MKSISYLSVLAAAMGLVSCSSSSDEPEVKPVENLPADRIYVLNEGSYSLNNSNISMLSMKNPQEDIEDIFFAQNGQKLGETGQCLIREGNDMYVAVSGSNYIARLDSDCRLQARFSCNAHSILQGGIRFLASDGENVFGTFYGGYVAKFSKDLQVTSPEETAVRLSDSNLEGIAYLGGKLYVANSWNQEVDPSTGYTSFQYYDHLYVLDAKTLRNEKTIKIGTNPNVVEAYKDRIYVVTYGDYSTDPVAKCYQLNPSDDSVRELGNAYRIGLGNDKVYMMESYTDWTTATTTNTYHWYDIATGTYHDETFLKNAPAELSSEQVYMITVDPGNGDIYIGVTYYVRSNGDLYRFDKEGNFISKTDCGGQNPKMAVFF